MLLAYSLTLFLGAALLFVVQPMIGKMLLPVLGGTPAVWSTCMVFFQAALLGGYLYAHATTAWLGPRRQAVLHLAVLLMPLAFLSLDADRSVTLGAEASPVLSVLMALSVSIGPPFLVISATAPLLQTWFAGTGHRAARDPYFLYAASNLGSMLALIAYPALIEPTLALRGEAWRSQTSLWTVGYVLLVALTGVCAGLLWIGAPTSVAAASTVEPAGAGGVSGVRRLRWVALGFVSSSLLLGATTYITTDIAAVPLLWVLPLAVYLLTFIIAFGRWPAAVHRAIVGATVPAVLVVLLLMLSDVWQPIWVKLLEHFLLLLVVGLACHGELAADRPAARHLTGFYLLMSFGGVLGGTFNALIAPVVFNSTAEYPIMMALAAVLMSLPRPTAADARRWPRRRTAPDAGATAIAGPGDARRDGRPIARRLVVDVTLGLGVGAVAYVASSRTFADVADAVRLVNALGAPEITSEWLRWLARIVNPLLGFGPPFVLALLLRRRPAALGIALALVLAIAASVDAERREQIYEARSFFGVLRVTRSPDPDGYTELSHGTTLHGRQSNDPERQGEALSYYHRESPIGQVFAELHDRGRPLRIAVVGLGTGTLAAYARRGDTMTFYEIDALVRDVAFDRAYFTYVADAYDRGAGLRLELGDARVRLDALRKAGPSERYDLIVVDAFSSDAIPVHLLTREALRLYFDVLAPDGVLALHISSRHLRLQRVVARLAESAGLIARIQHGDTGDIDGGNEATWAVLGRTTETLGTLADDGRWNDASGELDARVGTWTDDFHDLVSVFRW